MIRLSPMKVLTTLKNSHALTISYQIKRLQHFLMNFAQIPADPQMRLTGAAPYQPSFTEHFQ